MRRDEEFVRDAILGTLPRPPDSVAPGGTDPPDFTLRFGADVIALEVTTLSSVYLAPDGTVGNRRTADEFLHALHRELLRDYSPLVPEGQFVMIHYEGPVTAARDYKKALRTLLETRLAGEGFNGKKLEPFDVAGNKVQIRQCRIDRPERHRIVGLVTNEQSIGNVLEQAAIILEAAIIKKAGIIQGLGLPGEKWLGLLNAYFLADVETYRQALRHLRLEHCFSRLFLVLLDGSVEDIMAQRGARRLARQPLPRVPGGDTCQERNSSSLDLKTTSPQVQP